MLAIPVALLDIFIVLLIVTAIVLSWWALVPLETRARQFGALGNWLGDRAADIRNATYVAAKAIIDGSITAIVAGLRLFTQFMHDIARDVSAAIAWALNDLHNGINWVIANVLNPAVAELHALHAGVDWWIQTQIVPAIAELHALHAGVDFLISHVINPALADLKALGHLLRLVVSVQIPAILQITKSIQEYLAWWEAHVFKPVRADVAWITSVIPGMLKRIRDIELALAGILPLIGAMGLSLSLARVLGRIARNPCYCLEEDGATDLVPLVFYLFEEAM